MNLTTALYLTDFLGSIGDTSFPLGVGGLFVLGIAAIGRVLCCDEYIDRKGAFERTWISVLKKWPIPLVFMSISCAIPSKSTMYMMLGSSYLQDSSIPTKVSRALELKLDDYIKELMAPKKEDK